MEDIKFFIAVLLTICFIVWIGLQVLLDFSTQATCLAYGWKDSRVTWNFKRYCVREEDEWEVVKPLSVILEESK